MNFFKTGKLFRISGQIATAGVLFVDVYDMAQAQNDEELDIATNAFVIDAAVARVSMANPVLGIVLMANSLIKNTDEYHLARQQQLIREANRNNYFYPFNKITGFEQGKN